MDAYISGLLLMADERDLIMERQHVEKLIAAYGLTASDNIVDAMLEYCRGYPLGVQMICLVMKDTGGYTSNTLEETCIRCFHYFDSAFLGLWEDEIQHFLLCMADFETRECL